MMRKGINAKKWEHPQMIKQKEGVSILKELVYCILLMKQKLHCMKSALVSMITLQWGVSNF